MSASRAKWLWAAIALALLAVPLLLPLRDRPEPQPPQAILPAPCSPVLFERTDFIVCAVDPARYRIVLSLNDNSGRRWHDLKRFSAAMHPVFAMNAGMYDKDLSPVGLYIENGRQAAPLQTGAGDGNFFMKPNGVFGLSPEGRPFVLQSQAYALSRRPAAYATQSGPMLVIDGLVHPRFEADGASRFIRNGAGVDRQGRAVFAISRQPVSFGVFARLFRDPLQCKNALYFDGLVSAFSSGRSIIEGGAFPAGPIVAVFESQAAPPVPH